VFKFAPILAMSGWLLLLACQGAEGGEPRHNGRPLKYWLHQYWLASEEKQKEKAEAEVAINAIGAKKAVPELLYMAAVKDGPVRRWLEKNGEKYHVKFLQPETISELQLDAITGFEVLGTNASFATGKLTELLQDNGLAFVATRCLALVGKTAEPALCQCLTNQDSEVREFALGPLASVTETVELYVDRVKPLLQDQDTSVRCATIVAIGAQTQAPDLALPLLLPELDSKDNGVAREVAEQLGNFGTNAAESSPRLILMAEGEREDPAKAALTAIPKVAPSKAVGILSNTVAIGNPNLMYTAVSQLRPIQEELALHLLIEQLRSPEQLRKLRAVEVAATYEATTPGLADALKAAAKDSSSDLSRQAKLTMRGLVQKHKEKNGTRVDIAGEPSYEGKSLGEWLEMREREGGLATNAVVALNHMGTNLIAVLVGRLSYREPIFDLPDENVSMGAAFGLMALKEKAVPALPQLRSLMNSEDQGLALRAMIATVGTGKEAASCIIAGLTNNHPVVRSEAASVLSCDWSAQFPDVREMAKIEIVKLLEDPDPDVRVSATNDLWEMDRKLALKNGIKPVPSVVHR